MALDSQVAFITGGASGMGLAVVEDLVKKGWNVSIFDFDNAAGDKVAQKLCDQILFTQGNVMKYDEQVAAFVQTWKKWGRIDFVYANAGIGERNDIYAPQEELPNGGPPQPSMLTLDVDLYGPIWTMYLALHFFRKNASKAGKLVFTASSAGLYAAGSLPIYATAKTGLLGLTRAMGQQLQLRKEPITVNAICPGIVPSGLMPQTAVDSVPPEYITVHQTIVDAIQRFLSDDSLTGHVLECSGRDLISRPVCKPENDAAAFMLGGTYVKDWDMEKLKQHTDEKKVVYDSIAAASA